MNDPANLICYAAVRSTNVGGNAEIVGVRGRSVRSAIMHCVCSHRRHLRLDNLRTLILGDNSLSRIQLATDDDGEEDDGMERVIINT